MKNSLFFSLAFLFAITFNVYGQVPDYVPSDGLVAWYPFNGNANDESGNGNDGALNGPTLTDDRHSNNNSAYYFSSSGCGTRIDVDNMDLSSTTNGFSLSFWIKKTGNGCIYPRIFDFYSGQASNSWGAAWGNSDNLDWINTSLSTGTWYHVVYCYDGVNFSSFLNSVSQVNIPYTKTLPFGNDVAFGRMNHPAWDAFNGNLDDIGIWNKVLSSQEIQDLYSAEISFTGCTDYTACNYNPEAIEDDGSCDYTCCPGPGCCDEGTYWNEDTQTCIITNLTDTNLDGCTDLNDLMDILAAYGDCAVPEIILGCMDDTALNFNPDATEDDGSCEYSPILTNYSMHFSGNTAQHLGTDYITMPNAIQYDLTGDFTIEFWIKFTSLAYSHIMGINAFGSNSNGWLIKKPSDQMVLGWTYVPNEFGFYTVPSTNTWNHIAICFNDGTNTVKTFIDGNLHSTESRDININTSPFDLVIGREGTYSNYFQGYIDEVRLSNVSRYSIAFSPFTRHESDENTVGLWHFDEGEGSTASDSSSFENDGSITGADYSTDTPFTYAP